MFITDEIDISRLIYPASFDERTLFFDIETSGVSYSRSHITVIGAAYIADGKIHVLQWFADVPGSEPYIIQDFFDHLKGFDTLVTYNGISFDVPYVKKRATHWGLDLPDSHPDHIDLFKYSRPFANIYRLGNRKLKTVEHELFIDRTDCISGGDCVSVYMKYLQNGDPGLRDLILLHNKDDIVNLIDTSYIKSYYDILHGEFMVTGTYVSEKEIIIECRSNAFIPRTVSVRSDLHSVYIEEHEMRISFYGFPSVKKLYRKNYKDYYYLPSDDMAVHKSVGQFVNKASRVQATAATCYEKHEAVFFAQPDKIITPCFQDELKDETTYFTAKELPEDSETLRFLCMSVIDRFF